MSIHLEAFTASKKVLFLQGPMGGFFNRIAKWLSQRNIDTYKINLNGGDWFYTESKAFVEVFDYKDSLNNFNKYLNYIIKENEIDSVVCFGDCRKYHIIAKQVTERLGINFFVFEEGYIRPNFITFEMDGVNDFSNFKCDFSKGEQLKKKDKLLDVQGVDNKYYKMVISAIVYYIFTFLLGSIYKNYQHHRGLSAFSELFAWFISGYRRVKNALSEPRAFKEFQKKYSQQYFVFPLQVHNDSQLSVHSDLKYMEKYIDFVVGSFAGNALQQQHLLIKHHPMDRGYRHYAKLIKHLAAQYGVSERVHYFCDIHLPTLLRNSLGLVTVNSTTGLQALYHAVPVKVLGRALYDLPQLTYQKDLDKFWCNATAMNKADYALFRLALIQYSQLNGAYYGKVFLRI